MAITNFQPEIWSAALLTALEKALVFGNVVNRDYEGEIANAGDTVRITSTARPTIRDYAKDTDMTRDVLTDSQQVLTIDQAKYFDFEVDDIDKAQSANGGALLSKAAHDAAYGFADVADQFIASKMALSANALGVVDATTSTNVYEKLLVPARTKLSQNNVPTQGRWIVVDPATYGQLLLDSRFVKANESGDDALHTGFVGRAAGFLVYESNNAPQANRTAITATTVSGAKSLTATAGTFSQGDVGLTVNGTGIGATNKIASVNADGSVAQTTVNQSASATVADIALSGGGQLAIAGSNAATTYAEQINKVEAFRPEARMADALKGLHLFGAKVVRPEALAVASVKVA